MHDLITYNGKVTIKIKNKPPVKTKNSGTPILFNMLCNILSGALSDSSSLTQHTSLPCYMSIITDASVVRSDKTVETDYNKLKTYSIVTDLLPITSKSIESTSNSITLSTLLVYSMIKTTAVASLTETSTCTILLLDSQNKILAFSEFDFASIQSVCIDPNIQAVIDWNMSFTNK